MKRPDESGIVVLDALAEERFHLARDDFFLASVLHAHASSLVVYSSPVSVAAIRAARFSGVTVGETPFHSKLSRRFVPARVRCILRTLLIRRVRPDARVLFQSFYEPAVVLFSWLRPQVKFYLIVTNNLSVISGTSFFAGLKRKLLSDALERSTGVFVFSRHAVDVIRRLNPRIDAGKIHLLRFHQAGIVRHVNPFEKRERRISYIGWARADKGLDEFLRMVQADPVGHFRYSLCGKFSLTPEQADFVAQVADRLEVMQGYIPDTVYIELFQRSMFVVLPYGDAYAGSLSGVLCDAISTGTPIIASRIEPFIEYFETFGSLGHLVEFGAGELPRKVYEVPTAEEYTKLQCNLLRARREHDAASIATRYLEGLFGAGANQPRNGRKPGNEPDQERTLADEPL